MEKNIATASLNVARPAWTSARLVPRIVHLGCGAFHRAHQAFYTHQLLANSDSDWGICEVSLMPGNSTGMIATLKAQNFLYCVAEQDATDTQLTVIGAIKEALHPETDGCESILHAMTRPETAIVSLTITEKGYCFDAFRGQPDFTHPLIQHDLVSPERPQSAVGYIVEALRRIRQSGQQPFSVLSCDNLRENGRVTQAVVLGLAHARDPDLAKWIAAHVTFPSTMVDRIVPASTEESRRHVALRLGADDPLAVTCEPYRQWIIEDNFVKGRPAWDRVGAQFVTDVVPYEMMKLRMLNGSHSFLAYLGCLDGYDTIAATLSHPAYSKAVLALMLKEQAPTLKLPYDYDLQNYAQTLLRRFTNAALKHSTEQIAADGSQKLPHRLLDSVRYHLAHGSECALLMLGVTAWMCYVSRTNEQGMPVKVVDPLTEQLAAIVKQSLDTEASVRSLLALEQVFGSDLPADLRFVNGVLKTYRRLKETGAKATVLSILTASEN
ncbi:fructuronate reductase [Pantoea osteomyelitidis]|uniref:Fructuronate reductase n=1 Tax=Pantoea osteomyelitidis TaxID=3230026 RepID=A0ABW7PZV4_9GAMM